MRMMALESLKRQNMMKEYNPMDDENEQSLPMRAYKGQDEGAFGGADEARDQATGTAAYGEFEAYQRKEPCLEHRRTADSRKDLLR